MAGRAQSAAGRVRWSGHRTAFPVPARFTRERPDGEIVAALQTRVWTSMTPVDDDTYRVARYRWTCPWCPASKTGIAAADENVWTKAVEGLKTHIRRRSGEGHGPAGSVPPGLDDRALLAFVETSFG